MPYAPTCAEVMCSWHFLGVSVNFCWTMQVCKGCITNAYVLQSAKSAKSVLWPLSCGTWRKDFDLVEFSVYNLGIRISSSAFLVKLWRDSNGITDSKVLWKRGMKEMASISSLLITQNIMGPSSMYCWDFITQATHPPNPRTPRLVMTQGLKSIQEVI